jgi:excinuclease ABC subunit C
MKLASRSQDFEKAGKIRDQIQALEKVISHARVFDAVEIPPRQIKGWDYKRIEAYDISNIQGKEASGAMVVFRNYEPDKSQYRKFKIKVAGKPNDIAMLKEVLRRRFKHPEWQLPDLILVDGGKAQLNAAVNCKLQIPNCKHIKVMAIAKKKNELFIEGRKKSIMLNSLPREIFNLILQLRDEAHRFAISYHKKLRERRLLSK